MAVVVHQVPAWHAVAAFVIVICLAAILPQRRATALATGRNPATGTAWPDTGMKVAVDALAQPCFIVDRRGITRYVNAVAGRQFSPSSRATRCPSACGRQRCWRRLPGDRRRPGGAHFVVEKVPTESWFEAYIAPVRLPASHKGGHKPGGSRPDFVLVSCRT